MTEKKIEILKTYFGYEQFREGQEILIDSILKGQDVLGIMPTGAGKSLCFQIPALMMQGITLVVSPLISLMKDQVGALNQAGVHAAYLNSSLTYPQYRKALQYAGEGRYKIIYVAPERLLTPEFIDFAVSAEISMLSVDEAHCVSQWGHDFRSSYLHIAEFVERLPKRPVLSAFTATATRMVREDIIRILKLQQPEILVTGFDRKNLFFSVETPKNKYGFIKEYLEEHRNQCGIIYCATRKNVEDVCSRLEEEGFSVTKYHAGLNDSLRKQNQEEFIFDRKMIMVATNAFGMGIDKSNVRFVLHYNMPKNMESYYQEAGRAGRDGEPGECILLYSGQDVITNQFFIDNNQENQELEPALRKKVMENDRELLKKMTYYCFTNECLRDYILRYFGEYGENYCGNCSNCFNQFETVDVTEIALAVLSCVESSCQRYGTTVIIDTLRGANTAKIRQYGMNQNPYYGRLGQIPVYKLRQILNYLLLNDYLTVTNDEYMLLKLSGKAGKLLYEEKRVLMKLAKERVPKEKKERKEKIKGTVLTEKDEELFEKLRGLRIKIAKAEKVPPYIVFSDKTLIQMCSLKPETKEEMLMVSGVGEFKFEKYGESFLKVIRQEKQQ